MTRAQQTDRDVVFFTGSPDGSTAHAVLQGDFVNNTAPLTYWNRHHLVSDLFAAGRQISVSPPRLSPEQSSRLLSLAAPNNAIVIRPASECKFVNCQDERSAHRRTPPADDLNQV